ncbi:MAG: hypothetical protein D6682_02385 [Zetaproteobacteria bacterium]|nr:MAG: hypothetical protein D6682_02385 [Zetaproteobacteria bacterium]
MRRLPAGCARRRRLSWIPCRRPMQMSLDSYGASGAPASRRWPTCCVIGWVWPIMWRPTWPWASRVSSTCIGAWPVDGACQSGRTIGWCIGRVGSSGRCYIEWSSGWRRCVGRTRQDRRGAEMGSRRYTERQRRFARAYVRLGCATRAAIEAGYKPDYADRQGSRRRWRDRGRVIGAAAGRG